jgi:intraflagellar transport protein 122
MGVTDSDWKMLAMDALMAMDLPVATKAYIKVRDMKSIDLINRIKASRRLPGHNDQVFLAEALALNGQLQEAGKMYVKCGRVDLAIQLYSDLKRWEDARDIAASTTGTDIKDLTREQAQWAIESKDWKTAADILVTSEEYAKAIDIMGEHGMMDALIDVVRRLDKSDTINLQKCAAAFRRNGSAQYAKETYVKMGNTAELMEVYMETEKWEEAFLLLGQHPQMAHKVYLPYAAWLANNDRFEEAQMAFRKAGRPAEAIRMLSTLSEAAVSTNNFREAAYYYWMLAVASGKQYPEGSQPAHVEIGRQVYEDNAAKADLYYAYHTIYAYIKEPFTAHQPENVFNTARFLLHRLQFDEPPPGIRKSYILWAMAEQASKLGCYKVCESVSVSVSVSVSAVCLRMCLCLCLCVYIPNSLSLSRSLSLSLTHTQVARRALDLLSNLRLAPSWQDKVDLACIRIRAKPLEDKDEFFSGENVFSGVRSFINFEVLPLVEFKLKKGISAQQADALISLRNPAHYASSKRAPAGRYIYIFLKVLSMVT